METRPDIIVTHCPGCIMQLKHGLKHTGHEDIQVLDLAQIVAAAME
jgi:Fe-S oxidoreductase